MALDASIPLNGALPPRKRAIDTIGSVLHTMNEQREADSLDEERQARVQEHQQNVLKQQKAEGVENALNTAMNGALVKNPDGTSTFDRAKIAAGLAGTSAASKWPDIDEHFAKAETASLSLRQKRLEVDALEADHVGSIAAAAEAAGNDPGVLLTGFAQGVASGALDRDHVKSILSALQPEDGTEPTPETTKRLIATLKAKSKEMRAEAEKVTTAQNVQADRVADNDRQDRAAKATAADRAARLDLAKKEFEYRKANGGSDPDNGQWRQYSAWLNEWHKVHSVNADDPQSVQKYLPAPSFDDWRAANGRIDVRSGRVQPSDAAGRPPATGNEKDIELPSGKTAGVIVTKPGTTQQFKFPDQAKADAALKAWTAALKKK